MHKLGKRLGTVLDGIGAGGDPFLHDSRIGVLRRFALTTFSLSPTWHAWGARKTNLARARKTKIIRQSSKSSRLSNTNDTRPYCPSSYTIEHLDLYVRSLVCGCCVVYGTKLYHHRLFNNLVHLCIVCNIMLHPFIYLLHGVT